MKSPHLLVPVTRTVRGTFRKVIPEGFGFMLAALVVQLMLSGLSDVGVIHLTTH